jgi:hypothetical protein
MSPEEFEETIFPSEQNVLSFHPSENEQTSSIMVWFLPVPDNSLSSHRYYVISAKGRHKGYECVGKYYYTSKQ